MPSWNEGFFCFFFIGKSLSPLTLEPETSHKPSASLYHVSQASRARGCLLLPSARRININIQGVGQVNITLMGSVDSMLLIQGGSAQQHSCQGGSLNAIPKWCESSQCHPYKGGRVYATQGLDSTTLLSRGLAQCHPYAMWVKSMSSLQGRSNIY